jgi:hypothetical protein
MIIINVVEIILTVIKKGWINMFAYIEQNPLPPLLAEIFAQETGAIIEVSGRNREPAAFSCNSLQTLNGVTLILGIEHERTDAGRGMVRGLWSEKPIVIWTKIGAKTYRIMAKPYRCHIVGPVFSKVLERTRLENPLNDISAVWELLVDNYRETTETPPAPILQIPEGEPEYHLDHPFFTTR